MVADVAYASRSNLLTHQALTYGDVMALPRTWKFSIGKATDDLVPHLPRRQYTQMRMMIVNTQRRLTFSVYAKHVRSRCLGDVMLALAIMTSLLLLTLCAKGIPADRPWSPFHLRRAFAWEVIQAQCGRLAGQMALKVLRMGTAA